MLTALVSAALASSELAAESSAVTAGATGVAAMRILAASARGAFIGLGVRALPAEGGAAEVGVSAWALLWPSGWARLQELLSAELGEGEETASAAPELAPAVPLLRALAALRAEAEACARAGAACAQGAELGPPGFALVSAEEDAAAANGTAANFAVALNQSWVPAEGVALRALAILRGRDDATDAADAAASDAAAAGAETARATITARRASAARAAAAAGAQLVLLVSAAATSARATATVGAAAGAFSGASAGVAVGTTIVASWLAGGAAGLPASGGLGSAGGGANSAVAVLRQLQFMHLISHAPAAGAPTAVSQFGASFGWANLQLPSLVRLLDSASAATSAPAITASCAARWPEEVSAELVSEYPGVFLALAAAELSPEEYFASAGIGALFLICCAALVSAALNALARAASATDGGGSGSGGRGGRGGGSGRVRVPPVLDWPSLPLAVSIAVTPAVSTSAIVLLIARTGCGTANVRDEVYVALAIAAIVALPTLLSICAVLTIRVSTGPLGGAGRRKACALIGWRGGGAVRARVQPALPGEGEGTAASAPEAAALQKTAGAGAAAARGGGGPIAEWVPIDRPAVLAILSKFRRHLDDGEAGAPEPGAAAAPPNSKGLLRRAWRAAQLLWENSDALSFQGEWLPPAPAATRPAADAGAPAPEPASGPAEGAPAAGTAALAPAATITPARDSDDRAQERAAAEVGPPAAAERDPPAAHTRPRAAAQAGLAGSGAMAMERVGLLFTERVGTSWDQRYQLPLELLRKSLLEVAIVAPPASLATLGACAAVLLELCSCLHFALRMPLAERRANWMAAAISASRAAQMGASFAAGGAELGEDSWAAAVLSTQLAGLAVVFAGSCAAALHTSVTVIPSLRARGLVLAALRRATAAKAGQEGPAHGLLHTAVRLRLLDDGSALRTEVAVSAVRWAMGAFVPARKAVLTEACEAYLCGYAEHAAHPVRRGSALWRLCGSRDEVWGSDDAACERAHARGCELLESALREAAAQRWALELGDELGSLERKLGAEAALQLAVAVLDAKLDEPLTDATVIGTQLSRECRGLGADERTRLARAVVSLLHEVFAPLLRRDVRRALLPLFPPAARAAVPAPAAEDLAIEAEAEAEPFGSPEGRETVLRWLDRMAAPFRALRCACGRRAERGSGSGSAAGDGGLGGGGGDKSGGADADNGDVPDESGGADGHVLASDGRGAQASRLGPRSTTRGLLRMLLRRPSGKGAAEDAPQGAAAQSEALGAAAGEEPRSGGGGAGDCGGDGGGDRAAKALRQAWEGYAPSSRVKVRAVRRRSASREQPQPQPALAAAAAEEEKAEALRVPMMVWRAGGLERAAAGDTAPVAGAPPRAAPARSGAAGGAGAAAPAQVSAAAREAMFRASLAAPTLASRLKAKGKQAEATGV